MFRLRQSPSGSELKGNAVGDLLRWNGTEWVASSVAVATNPLSRMLFVDGGTLVPPADQDGSILAPFSTIAAGNAAIALLLAGPALLYVAPGVYVETVVPPNRDGYGIIGAGPGLTLIDVPPPAGAALQWSPPAAAGAAILSFYCADLTFRSTDATKRCIDIVSQTFAPDNFLGGTGAIFENVQCITPAAGLVARLTGISRVTARSCIWNGDPVLVNGQTLLENCSRFFATNTSQFGALDLSWNVATPAPATGRSVGYQFAAASIVNGPVTLRAQVRFSAFPTARLLSTVTGAGLTSVAGVGPVIAIQDFVSGAATLAIDTTGGGGTVVLFSQGATFNTTASVSVSAGVSRVSVEARSAQFRSVAANGVLAGDGVDMDLRGAIFNQTALGVAGTGTIDRTLEGMAGLVIPAGPSSTAFPFSVPFPAAAVARLAPALSQSATGLALAVTAITAAGVTIDAPAVAPGQTASVNLLRTS